MASTSLSIVGKHSVLPTPCAFSLAPISTTAIRLRSTPSSRTLAERCLFPWLTMAPYVGDAGRSGRQGWLFATSATQPLPFSHDGPAPRLLPWRADPCLPSPQRSPLPLDEMPETDP